MFLWLCLYGYFPIMYLLFLYFIFLIFGTISSCISLFMRLYVWVCLRSWVWLKIIFNNKVTPSWERTSQKQLTHHSETREWISGRFQKPLIAVEIVPTVYHPAALVSEDQGQSQVVLQHMIPGSVCFLV